jgi:hypothetical protein
MLGSRNKSNADAVPFISPFLFSSRPERKTIKKPAFSSQIYFFHNLGLVVQRDRNCKLCKCKQTNLQAAYLFMEANKAAISSAEAVSERSASDGAIVALGGAMVGSGVCTVWDNKSFRSTGPLGETGTGDAGGKTGELVGVGDAVEIPCFTEAKSAAMSSAVASSAFSFSPSSSGLGWESVEATGSIPEIESGTCCWVTKGCFAIGTNSG